MAGYNRVIMMGNLTRDPELRAVGSQSVCKLSIASNRQHKNKQTGALVQEVCFIDVDVWGAQADTCKMYLQKGRPVLVEGRLKLDSWKDQEGNARTRYSIVSEKIVFLSFGDQQHDEQSHGAEDVSASAVDAIVPAKDAVEYFDDAKSKRSGVRQKKQPEVSFKDQAPFEEDLPF